MSITTEEKIGYLVLNTGTPDAPTIPALRSYLKEFLSDPDKPFKVCYQSTFGPEQWIQPNIVDVLEDLAEKGVKKVSVACPSFTADCLETLEEIAVENHEDFEKNGGEYVKLIPSLNDNDDWVQNFAEYLTEKEDEFIKK